MGMRLVVIVGLVASGLACSGGSLDNGGKGGDGGSVGTGSGTGVGTGVGGGVDGGAAGSVGTGGSVGAGGAVGAGGSGGTAGSVGTGGSVGAGGAVGGTGGSAGGSAGAGGSSPGGSGGAGVGGTGGRPVLPACTDIGTDAGGGSIVGSDSMAVSAPVSAAVTVASIDGCTAAPCPPPMPNKARQIVLASADQRQWTLSLSITAMPADLIQVGDAFDLNIDAGIDAVFHATVSQTVVLSRAGHLIAFASNRSRFYAIDLPNLAAFGISVADGGAYCGSAATTGCIPETHRVVVTVEGASAIVMPNHATTIGWLSFTAGNTTALIDTGFCDNKSTTGTAGFRLP